MYEEHPWVNAPDKESIMVWRYMNYAKFESLLDKKALFFAKPAKFEDPLEGLFSDATLDDMLFLAESCGENSIENLESWSLPRTSKNLKEMIFLNCWHMSEYESAAMWKLYSKDGAGISIQSSFEKLKACFSESQYTVHIGVVKYIGWKKDKISRKNYFYPYFHKRKSFDHERELRALVYAHKNTEKIFYNEGKPVNVPTIEPLDLDGIFVTISLETLIENIYVSPKSSERFKSRVEKVLKKHYLDKKVIKSDLYNGPLY